MDIIGFDASVIGHHELDFGPDSFADFVESFDSHTPFLSANLDVGAEPRLAALSDAGLIAPSVVLDIGDERIGIIGVTTPDIAFISNPRDIVVNADTLSAVRSEVDLLVSRSVNKISGVVRVAGGMNTDAVTPHPEVQSEVVEPVQNYIAGLSDKRVGEVQVLIESQYPDMRTMETNEGNLIADALLWQARQAEPDLIASAPTVSVFNGGGIGNISVPASHFLTELHLFSILRFPDLMVIVRELGPADFKDVLENAFSQVEASSGRFPHGSGYTVVYDPSAEPRVADENDDLISEGRRVIEITLSDGTPIVRDGAVVEGAPAVNLVTNRFLASGGDQYPLAGFEITPLDVFTHDALAGYIRDALGGVITAQQYPEPGQGLITAR